MHTLQDFIDGKINLSMKSSNDYDIIELLKTLDSMGIVFTNGKKVAHGVSLNGTVSGIQSGIIVMIVNNKTMTSLIRGDIPVVHYKDLILPGAHIKEGLSISLHEGDESD